MRCPRGLAIIILSFLHLVVRAQSPDDRYSQIYSLIEEADTFRTGGVVRSAVTKYLEAEAAIKELQRLYPDWNSKMLSFRLQYISSMLEPLIQKGAVSAVPSTGQPAAAGAVHAEAVPDGLKLAQEENLRLAARNALLEAKLREALSVQPSPVDPRELARAEAKVRQLEKERDLMAAAVEQSRSSAAPVASQAGAARSEVVALKQTISGLEASNRVLREEQTAMERRLLQLVKGRAPSDSPGNAELGKQLEAARAKLQVLEANQIPYSAEELALFKQEPTKVGAELTNAPPAGGRGKRIPPGAGPLVAEALRAIDGGRFAEAEQKYRDVLRQDEQNMYILANLAAVQMDQEKIADAEATLQKALAIEPNDAPSLYLMGNIKLRQEKLAEAFEALSLSAKLDPEKPQTQYFLGKTLVQKGDRGPAEIALRKAIQLKPDWGEPHSLLAVLYATQKPAFRELAQYHYSKAIKGGVPRNTELEKLMEQSGSPAR